VHQLFIATSLQFLLPVIQTICFSVQRFSIRRKKNPQKLNIIFLDQTAEITSYTVIRINIKLFMSITNLQLSTKALDSSTNWGRQSIHIFLWQQLSCLDTAVTEESDSVT
jgi:hypothetical protein